MNIGYPKSIECCQAFFKSWRFHTAPWLLWQVCGPLTGEGAAVFGPTRHLCHVPMHITVTLLGAGKECWSSFGSTAPPPEQINTWAVCLRCLLSFCTARLFCRERSMALISSSLQQVMWGRALRWHYTDCGGGSSWQKIHSTLTRDIFHPWRVVLLDPAAEHHSSETMQGRGTLPGLCACLFKHTLCECMCETHTNRPTFSGSTSCHCVLGS